MFNCFLNHENSSHTPGKIHCNFDSERPITLCCFPCFQTLYNHIVSDIKRINAKHKNNKVNRVSPRLQITNMQVGDKRVHLPPPPPPLHTHTPPISICACLTILTPTCTMSCIIVRTTCHLILVLCLLGGVVSCTYNSTRYEIHVL